jgi:hypothetical protein
MPTCAYTVSRPRRHSRPGLDSGRAGLIHSMACARLGLLDGDSHGCAHEDQCRRRSRIDPPLRAAPAVGRLATESDISDELDPDEIRATAHRDNPDSIARSGFNHSRSPVPALTENPMASTAHRLSPSLSLFHDNLLPGPIPGFRCPHGVVATRVCAYSSALSVSSRRRSGSGVANATEIPDLLCAFWFKRVYRLDSYQTCYG